MLYLWATSVRGLQLGSNLISIFSDLNLVQRTVKVTYASDRLIN